MHKQTLDLLERLLAATQENRIQWTEVTGKTAFSYMAGDYVLVIDANSARASFRLSDGHGRTLDEADESDLNSAQLASGGTALDAVRKMHAIAKRQATGTDTAIASVMEHLQSLESTKGGAKNEAEPVQEARQAEPEDHKEASASSGDGEAEAVAAEPPLLAPGAAPQQAAAPEQAQAEQAHPGEGEAEGGERSSKADGDVGGAMQTGTAKAAGADTDSNAEPATNGASGHDAEAAGKTGADTRPNLEAEAAHKKKRSLFHPFGGKR